MLADKRDTADKHAVSIRHSSEKGEISSSQDQDTDQAVGVYEIGCQCVCARVCTCE